MKSIKLLIMLSMILVLSGCAINNTKEKVFEEDVNLVDIGDFGYGLDLVRDKNTGCVYIYKEAGNRSNVSAYYGEDGKVVGCGEEQFDKSKYE